MPKCKRLVMIEILSFPAHHLRAPVARRLADSRMQEHEMTSEMQAAVLTGLWRASQ
jgi:hypothetical protein